MSYIANVKYRQLPLGDDGTDDGSDVFSDVSAQDLFELNPPAPILPTPTITNPVAPNIPFETSPGYVTGMTPTYIDQTTGLPGYLPVSLAAQNPMGIPVTDQVAAGITPDQAAAAVLASGGTQAEANQASAANAAAQASYASAAVTAAGGTPAQAAAAAAAASGIKTSSALLTSTAATRPSPVTVATGIPAAGVTYANPLNSLSASTIIPGVPNYMIFAAVIGVALLAGSKKR